MLGPVLRGEKITLEPPKKEDIPLLLAWQADLEVYRYVAPLPGPRTIQQMEAQYEELASTDRALCWSIVADGKTVGLTYITNIDWINRQAESTLMIGDRSAWGKGYATEAVRLRTRFAFDDLGLERLESNSVAENVAMHRALERCGYREVGRKRHCFYRHGKWHDRIVFEVLRDEWRGT
jgi:RimJ/RimL family protein N-acetyltransferase